MKRVMRRFAVAVICAAALGGPAIRPVAAQPARHVPVFAYFYQWFERSSWQRAKQDHPLAGNYSSDDPHVLRDQIEQARAAGIDGFMTSWKRTAPLDRRLELLLTIAASEKFSVGVVYQGLDFYRNPLPVATVQRDMTYLVGRWGARLHSSYFDRPVIVWTGTDQFSVAAVRTVRAALGRRAYLLAAAKSVEGYQRVAADVDGEAYYWSSSNPRSPSTLAKLDSMSAAVHRDHGIWFAPAAPGFDGRTLGHSRVIARDGGSTFRLSLDRAYASRPDAVGVISWNEWSENTYIEPGQRYRGEEVRVLREYLAARTPRGTPDQGQAGPPVAPGWWTGLRAAVALTVICAVGLIVLLLVPHRPHRHRRRRHTTDPRDDRELSNART
jgi:hypothetical protein